MTISQSQSYWNATAPVPDFPRLSGDSNVDVAIIGVGLVGTITATLLKNEGRTVAIIEARKIGQEVTGKSTAKITSQHNIIYSKLREKHGIDAARTYAEANQAGLRCILEVAARHQINADIEPKAAYAYTERDEHVAEIEREVDLAREIGLPASLTRETGLPFPVRAAMRWDDQAQFHPVKFAVGLAGAIPGDGCHVYEHSRAVDWDTDRVMTNHGT